MKNRRRISQVKVIPASAVDIIGARTFMFLLSDLIAFVTQIVNLVLMITGLGSGSLLSALGGGGSGGGDAGGGDAGH